MDWRKYIRTDPEIAHGQTCFVGTRMPVSVVLDNLGASNSPEVVLKGYPSQSCQAVKAAIAYAAELSKDKILSISGRRRAAFGLQGRREPP
jgi:uncharacterized protein (DUF433 family)